MVKLIACMVAVISGMFLKRMLMAVARMVVVVVFMNSYHKGEAVFHDGEKYWSCCPQTRVLEFDEFMKIPGCVVGKHDDGRE